MSNTVQQVGKLVINILYMSSFRLANCFGLRSGGWGADSLGSSTPNPHECEGVTAHTSLVLKSIRRFDSANWMFKKRYKGSALEWCCSNPPPHTHTHNIPLMFTCRETRWSLLTAEGLTITHPFHLLAYFTAPDACVYTKASMVSMVSTSLWRNGA